MNDDDIHIMVINNKIYNNKYLFFLIIDLYVIIFVYIILNFYKLDFLKLKSNIINLLNILFNSILLLYKRAFKVELTEVCWVAGMSLVLAFLATLYPSWKASKTDPVEALKYE